MNAGQRRQERLNRPPTWRSAIQKGGIAALALFALVVIVFKASVGAGIPLAVLAAAIYIPAFYMTDSLLYRARTRRRERERARQADASD
jgi:hypothetical protein